MPNQADKTVEQMAEGPAWYQAMNYYVKNEMPIFVDDTPGRQQSIENAFLAGWKASFDKREPEIAALRGALEEAIEEIESIHFVEDDDRIGQAAWLEKIRDLLAAQGTASGEGNLK